MGDCLTLLLPPEAGGAALRCPNCGWTKPLDDLVGVELRSTHVRESEEGIISAVLSGGPAEALIDEDCPECSAKTLAYHTRQMRSADEGQTIFYHCLECGHKFTLDS